MKAKQDSMEGQLDIFEAMERAAAAVEKLEQEKPVKKKEKAPVKEKLAGKGLHAAMQRTYVNPLNDDFATVAYIDYHMVYWKEWNAPAMLERFADAKTAVEGYLARLKEIQKLAGVRQSEEHEPFADLVSESENLYREL